MAGSLNVGTLTGRIEFEDKITSTLDLVLQKVERLEGQFGSLGGSVAKSAAGFITAEAAIQGVRKVLDFTTGVLKDFTTEGASIADVEDNFDHLTASAGRLGATLLGQLREGTHNTIDDLSLMKTVNQDLAAGMNLTDAQYKVLTESAFALAQATGEDVKSAFEQVNDAMLTGRTRSIQMLTGRVDLVQAEQDYADSLGTTVDKLTEEGKVQAARQAILDKLADANERLGKQTDGLDEMIAQAQTTWNNYYDDLAKSVASSPNVIHAFESIRDAIMAAFGGDVQSALKTALEWINYLADRVAKYGPEVIAFFVNAKDWILKIYDTVTRTWDALPTWLKNVATNSALAMAGLIALNSGVSAGSSLVQDAIGLWGNLTTALVGLPNILSGVTEGLVKTREIVAIMDFSSIGDAIVSFKILGGAVLGAIGPLGALAIAVTAVMAAWEIGKMQKVSDWFENVGLRIMGYTEEQRKAMIETDHATQAAAAHVEANKAQSDAIAKTKAMMEDLAKQLNRATTEQIGLTGEQQKSKFVMDQTTDDIKKFKMAWEELNSVGKSYADTLKDVDLKTIESIKHYIDMGVGLGTLAAAYKMTNAEVQAIADAYKLEQKAQSDSAQRWAEYNQLVIDMSGNTMDKLESDIERWKKDQIQAHKDAKTDTKDFYDWVDKMSAAMYQKEEQKRIEDDQSSKAHFDKIARDAQEAYQFALRHADQFTEGHIADLKKASDAAAAAAANWKSTMGGAIDQTTIMVRTLAGEMITLEEKTQRMSAGGTYTISRANLAENLKTWGVPETLGFTLAGEGFSFQEILDAWRSKTYDKWKPQGPRIPGFKEGGVGDFGSGTLAMLHGKEAIVPLDRAGFGSITNTFYVNGTAEESARKISKILMSDLKSGRQFSMGNG